MSKNFSKLFKSAITVIISVLIVFTVVQAGNITPPSGTPEAQFYTLTEIYEFITNNTAATEGGHDFTFSDGLTGTHRTLTEIYNALASLISADQVKLGATYLGVDGTLVPSSGTATTTDVCSTKTYFGDSQTDWNLATGALTIDAAKVLSGTTYCGTDGSMTNVEQQIITPSIINLTISQGYHDGTGYCAGDADLVVGNIKKDVGIFGATGTLYGDIDPTKVLTVASANGTYNASNLTEDNIKLGIAFGASGESGTLTPDGGTAGVADLFNSKTAHLTDDWNLDTGTLNLACNTDTFNGTLNLVADDYDGAGSGNNRWCMKETGDAATGDILLNKKAWVDGIEITGNIANCSSEGGKTCYANSGYWTAFDRDGDNASSAQTADTSVNYFTAPTGFYDGNDRVSATDAEVAALDDDIAQGNILSGKIIFGVSGKTEVVDTTEATLPIAVGTVLADKVGFVNGSKITGTMVDNSSFGLTCGVSDQSVTAGYYSGGTLVGDAELVEGNIADSVEIFGVTGTLKNLLSDTNQFTCYNDTVACTCGAAGCTGDADWPNQTAQNSEDGNREDDLTVDGCGAGTVSDSLTGLCWEWDAETGGKNWKAALQECNSLDGILPGTGWRLPKANELVSIVDYGYEGSSYWHTTKFTNYAADKYWSSTTISNFTGNAYDMDFLIGTMSIDNKISTYYVVCVRDN